MSEGTSKKGGKGTHGSLSKAGKVRHVSPKNWNDARRANKVVRKKGSVITVVVTRNHKKKHASPLRRNKRLAHLRGDQKQGGLGREAGQYYPPLF